MPYTYYIEDKIYSSEEAFYNFFTYNSGAELLRAYSLGAFLGLGLGGAVAASIPSIPIMGRLLLITPLSIAASYLIDMFYDPMLSIPTAGTFSGREIVNFINEIDKLSLWSYTYYQDKSEIFKKMLQHEYADVEPLTLDDFDICDFPKNNTPGAVLTIHKEELGLEHYNSIVLHDETLVQETGASLVGG